MVFGSTYLLKDGKFCYVDEFNDLRTLYLWFQGTELHLADNHLNEEFSIEGKLITDEDRKLGRH